MFNILAVILLVLARYMSICIQRLFGNTVSLLKNSNQKLF